MGERRLAGEHLEALAGGLGVPVDALFATERREPVPARDGKLWEPVGPERPNGTRVSRVGLSSGELAKAEIVKARLVADGSALFQRVREARPAGSSAPGPR